ncbi:MAG TPA: hypothetical protein VLT81_05525 [Chondromyces sp.]|nr:hypothetical protein [Chondromyces sp.]
MRLVTTWTMCALAIAAAQPADAQSKQEQCTSAVIQPAGSTTGGSVLWKNRDTDVLSNKVVFVDEQPYDYLCLANFDARSGRTCWAGLNSEGFAIINTVAYNLPERGGEMEDLEGVIMADALRTCRTIADFEAFLEANLGPELGSLANFGVLDGEGGAMLYEVHNHGFEKIDPAGEPASCLLNTNYARTGAEGQGAGYLRFERAAELFRGLPEGPVDFRTILTTFSRDTGHVLVEQPTPFELGGVPGDRELWISTRDTINKAYTSAAVVLVGRTPGAAGSVATMWVIPGEPVTAVAVPLWVEAGASPELLWRGEKAPLWVESARLKKLARPFDEGNKDDYLNLTALDNAAGTGFLPALLEAERAIIAETDAFLSQPHSADEYREFQTRMAARALAAMEAAGQR